MRFSVWPKILMTCCFATASYAQQPAPVYQANAGQAPVANPGGQPQEQQTDGQEPNQPAGQQYAAPGQVGGSDFTPPVFRKSGSTFEKKTLGQNDVWKAVVIVFSVACPHCDTLLATLAPHVGKLNGEGIKVIFVNVPAGVKSGQPPTNDEHDQAVAKVTTHGITIDGNNTQVVVVADIATLSRYGITGLPVMMVIKKSVEQFRGIGQDAIQKVNFGDPATFSQLQAVFKDVGESEEEDAGEKRKGAGKAGGKSSGKGKKAATGVVAPQGVNRDLAREWTAILNSECGQSLPRAAASLTQPVQKQASPPKRGCECTCDVG